MEKESTLYKVLRIVLFVVIGVILLFLIYGVVKLVPKAINSIKGIGSGGTTLNISTDKPEVKPGEPFLIRTRHTNLVSGNYVLTYDCDDETIYFESLSASSTTRVACNATTTLPVYSLKQSSDQVVFETVVRTFTVAGSDVKLPSTIPFTISIVSSSTAKTLGQGKGTVILTNTPSATTTAPGDVQTTPAATTTPNEYPSKGNTTPANNNTGTNTGANNTSNTGSQVKGDGAHVTQPGTVISTAGTISGTYYGNQVPQYPVGIGTSFVNNGPIGNAIYPAQGMDLSVYATNISQNYVYNGYSGSAPQTIRVTVTNNSALSSGPWSFNISYPYEQFGYDYYNYRYGNNYGSSNIVPNLYNSVTQTALQAGESRTFDVNINAVARYAGQPMYITVVPSRAEYNYANNQYSVPVR